MSTINAANLELQLVQKINSATNQQELLAYSVALRQLQNSAVFVVQNFVDLPSASTSVGDLYYVVADARIYIATAAVGWQLLSVDTANVLWTWGRNNDRALGDGTTTNRCIPGTTSGGGVTWCQSSAGSTHAAGIKTDATLWTWGANTAGQLGDNTSTARCSPGTTTGAGATWRAVSAGKGNTTGAIKTDGTLWTWGQNNYGKLGDGTIATRSSPVQTSGLGSTWCTISMGNYHTVAVKTDGTLWTWGNNSAGRLGNSSTVSRSSPGQTCGLGNTWCTASAGFSHTAAVKTDGTLWTWGSNTCGSLGVGSTTSRSSPGQTCGLGDTWCTTSAGEGDHTFAIKTDGTLWTWGNNSAGRLGSGTTVPRSSPGSVSGAGTTWCQSSPGRYHGTAVKTDSTLWTWGGNAYGQLGDGTTTSRSSPGLTCGIGNTWCSASGGTHFTTGIQSIVF